MPWKYFNLKRMNVFKIWRIRSTVSHSGVIFEINWKYLFHETIIWLGLAKAQRPVDNPKANSDCSEKMSIARPAGKCLLAVSGCHWVRSIQSIVLHHRPPCEDVNLSANTCQLTTKQQWRKKKGKNEKMRPFAFKVKVAPLMSTWLRKTHFPLVTSGYFAVTYQSLSMPEWDLSWFQCLLTASSSWSRNIYFWTCIN